MGKRRGVAVWGFDEGGEVILLKNSPNSPIGAAFGASRFISLVAEFVKKNSAPFTTLRMIASLRLPLKAAAAEQQALEFPCCTAEILRERRGLSACNV